MVEKKIEVILIDNLLIQQEITGFFFTIIINFHFNAVIFIAN